tara:strand:- start:148 stop:750 length:603 start_codon:yes stop_codon:yes gene_type:complete
MTREESFYNPEFWFNNTNLHNQKQNVNGYGKEYYVYKLYENLVLKINNIPDNGYIVVLGSNKCISFDLLCQHFGKERCIGYDIYNPTEHSRVKVLDCSKLSDEHNIPIAFVHNDVGSFPLTPKLKLHAQKWAIGNLIEGGYFLSRNNLNSAKFDLEGMMLENNIFNTHLESLKDFIDLSMFDDKTIEGHMIGKKIKRVFY